MSFKFSVVVAGTLGLVLAAAACGSSGTGSSSSSGGGSAAAATSSVSFGSKNQQFCSSSVNSTPH